MITQMRSEHIQAVLQIHIDSFANSFLTQLGSGVLHVIYSEFSKSGFGYVSIEGNEVVGFIAGIYTPALQFYKNLLVKHPIRLPFLLVTSVIRNASVMKPILARARRLFRVTKNGVEEENPYTAIVNSKEKVAYTLTIAVAPHYRRKGIANQLYAYTIKDLSTNGVYAIVGSVIGDNTSMNAFNQKMGYKQLATMGRVDGKKEIKWLRYKRGECSVSEDGHVSWL
jgi:ribosomal protein S18 acetylase RimI-like enzyme